MTVSRGGVVMQGAWNTGAQYLPELVFILKSFVRSVSHFLDSLPAHSGTRTFHFFSLSFCTVILSEPKHHLLFRKKHAAAQRKFVSVCFLFLLLGNPLHMGLRNAFMYSHLTILLYS